jgi:hypothetical protein
MAPTQQAAQALQVAGAALGSESTKDTELKAPDSSEGSGVTATASAGIPCVWV